MNSDMLSSLLKIRRRKHNMSHKYLFYNECVSYKLILLFVKPCYVKAQLLKKERNIYTTEILKILKEYVLFVNNLRILRKKMFCWISYGLQSTENFHCLKLAFGVKKYEVVPADHTGNT